ncbi:alpha/beta hydrolase family protein [Sphingomicrobium flavum]|uniref:alpha/beta hydrolase family protein n=1 Tax=Sphingomicrobium flavum TaxID=1229164 RepID=UPI0021AE2780|nr:S9 family peptidase [Sphingomicrobium flavum]
MRLHSISIMAALLVAAPALAQDAPDPRFTGADLFNLTIAADPQISPDGRQIAYVRRANDIMSDGVRSSIWLIDVASGRQQPLIAVGGNASTPRWSPDGRRLAYVTADPGGMAQIHVRWLDSDASATITALPKSPGNMAWSPDGRRLAFSALVASDGVKLGKAPAKPEGAKWADPPMITDKVIYRFDGAGYLDVGFSQLFIVDANGGAPRQLTHGDRNHGSAIEWSPNGRQLLFSANLNEDWEIDALESEVHAIDLTTGAISTLTSRDGPDGSPQISPDGRTIAYLGFDDTKRGFRHAELYLMDRDGSNSRRIAANLDRNIDSLEWNDAGLFAGYEEEGGYTVSRISTSGAVSTTGISIADTYYSRPYAGGPWTVADDGTLAFTSGSTMRPSDVSVRSDGRTRQLTNLNDLHLSTKSLGEVREVDVRAADGTKIPSWIVLPPGWQKGQPVPTILEIHGGPYAAYGPHFSSDYQIYAAAGYATLYTNPGGSTGYGIEFADRIEGNYPISNGPELLAAVDAAVAAGYADPDNLFVTGGSGGGILTAWMIGITDRFKAAVSYKPVINWTSMALMSDGVPFFGPYWMKGLPWENPASYFERSPLSNMDKVVTPTLMMVGAEDYRTPRSEAEQFYGALKLKGVDTALYVTPGASHSDLSMSPSQQAMKAAAVIAWFDKYRTP